MRRRALTVQAAVGLGLAVWACGRTEVVSPGPRLDAGLSADGGGADAGRDAGRPDGGVPTPDGGADAGFDGGAVEPGPFVPKPCIEGRLPLERAVPIVMLLVDSSGSMAEPFDTAVKAQSVKGALRTVLPSWDPFMLLGLTLFPSAGGCSLSGSEAVQTPRRGQVDELVARLGVSDGNSPLAGAVEGSQAVLAPLQAANATRQQVLITDGSPNCNASLPSTTCRCGKLNCLPEDCLDDARSIARVSGAAAAGIATWVIGIDTPDAGVRGVLDGLAEAGLRARLRPDGRRYLHARTGNEVGLHLQAVGARICACSRISRSVGRATVFIGGRLMPEDSADGWAWVDRENGELAFTGASCDALVADPTLPADIDVRCPPGAGPAAGAPPTLPVDLDVRCPPGAGPAAGAPPTLPVDLDVRCPPGAGPAAGAPPTPPVDLDVRCPPGAGPAAGAPPTPPVDLDVRCPPGAGPAAGAPPTPPVDLDVRCPPGAGPAAGAPPTLPPVTHARGPPRTRQGGDRSTGAAGRRPWPATSGHPLARRRPRDHPGLARRLSVSRELFNDVPSR